MPFIMTPINRSLGAAWYELTNKVKPYCYTDKES